jgi:hypothetical protein
MVIFDEIVTWSDMVNTENSCRIRVVKLDSTGTLKRFKSYYIVASDLGRGTVACVTDAAPYLIPMICRDREIAMGDMVWFEHHPRKSAESEPDIAVAVPGPSFSCCGAGCSSMVHVDRRPALPNEISHLRTFIPDLL